MDFYTSDGKKIKFHKNLPEGAHYRDLSGRLAPMPTMKSSEDKVFDFVFACMSFSRPGISKDDVREIWDYYNEKKELVLEYLKALKNFYIAEGDKWRIRAYTTAYAAIKTSKIPIVSGDQAILLEGVGKSIGAKINEILETGKLDFIDKNVQTVLDRLKVIDLFMNIWGVGPKKARYLYDKGYRTYEDIPAKELTEQERIGLKYVEDFKERIPRREIERFEIILANFWSGVKFQIAGSYRRKVPSSGDIDVLVEDSGFEKLPDLVKKLGHYRLADLAMGSSKYMGVIKFGGKARRIDIRIVPHKSWGAALLYFTGSGEFNQRMRARALEKGLTLNEYRLARVATGETIPTVTEEDIFKAVGMKYIEPENRN